jgi:hypothetical protein
MRRAVPTTAILMLCIAAPAAPARAAKVKSGAMDICRIIDGGEYDASTGTEVCCGKEVRGDEDPGQGTGPAYCVVCDPPGSDDCETFTVGRPGGMDPLLMRVLLAQNQGTIVRDEQLRAGLDQVLDALGRLETRLHAVQEACSGRATSPGATSNVVE